MTDRHAEHRDQKRRRARMQMPMRGAGVRELDRLLNRKTTKTNKPQRGGIREFRPEVADNASA